MLNNIPIQIMKTVLVTGGCGFIASNFIHKLLDNGNYMVINVDKLNYCANIQNVTKKYDYDKHCVIDTNLDNYKFYKCDIANTDFIMEILNKHEVQIVYHFAAQTHVDQSFGNSTQFVVDNVLATSALLECCRVYAKLEKFIHVSTDEVYGDISIDREQAILKYGLYDPTNPYAATKACAELMVKSYYKSYKIPIIITRSNNVFGPHQYWEKIFGKFIYNLYHNQKCPVYGNGLAMRKYLYVDDACEAYLLIMEKGEIGQIYEMGSNDEFNILEILEFIVSKVKINSINESEKYLEFVEDRKFHDQRYLVNSETLEKLGWKNQTPFKKGLEKTVEWYVNYAIPNHHWNYDDNTTLNKNLIN